MRTTFFQNNMSLMQKKKRGDDKEVFDGSQVNAVAFIRQSIVESRSVPYEYEEVLHRHPLLFNHISYVALTRMPYILSVLYLTAG